MSFLHGITAYVSASDTDLSARQLGVLANISARPGYSVRELSGLLRISKPAVTRSVGLLIERSLMESTESPLDRRLVVLWPTRAGAKMARELEGMFGGGMSA